jgi:hypothetical protein
VVLQEFAEERRDAGVLGGQNASWIHGPDVVRHERARWPELLAIYGTSTSAFLQEFLLELSA